MVPLSATEDDMIDLSPNAFFPEGISVYGHTHELQLKLANFKCEEVIGRPVGWGGLRGSNEPPKIFEVGIFGELKR